MILTDSSTLLYAGDDGEGNILVEVRDGESNQLVNAVSGLLAFYNSYVVPGTFELGYSELETDFNILALMKLADPVGLANVSDYNTNQYLNERFQIIPKIQIQSYTFVDKALTTGAFSKIIPAFTEILDSMVNNWIDVSCPRLIFPGFDDSEIDIEKVPHSAMYPSSSDTAHLSQYTTYAGGSPTYIGGSAGYRNPLQYLWGSYAPSYSTRSKSGAEYSIGGLGAELSGVDMPAAMLYGCRAARNNLRLSIYNIRKCGIYKGGAFFPMSNFLSSANTADWVYGVPTEFFPGNGNGVTEHNLSQSDLDSSPLLPDYDASDVAGDRSVTNMSPISITFNIRLDVYVRS